MEASSDICMENNFYQISFPYSKQQAVKVSEKEKHMEFGVSVDGQDVLAVYKTAKEAIERARRRGTFINRNNHLQV